MMFVTHVQVPTMFVLNDILKQTGNGRRMAEEHTTLGALYRLDLFLDDPAGAAYVE